MSSIFLFKRLAALAALWPATVFAQFVSFRLQVDLLQTATLNTPMPTTGLVLLVADTTGNGFGAVPVTAIGSGAGNVFSSGLTLDGPAGDDLILWRGDLSAFSTPGLLAEYPENLGLGLHGNVTWSTGDALALFWFPELTVGSTATVETTTYGYVSGPSTPEGDPWFTPAAGTLDSRLYFITSNNTGETGLDGTATPSSLVASLNVAAIPEPGTTAALAGVAALVWTASRRRRRVGNARTVIRLRPPACA